MTVLVPAASSRRGPAPACGPRHHRPCARAVVASAGIERRAVGRPGDVREIAVVEPARVRAGSGVRACPSTSETAVVSS